MVTVPAPCRVSASASDRREGGLVRLPGPCTAAAPVGAGKAWALGSANAPEADRYCQLGPVSESALSPSWEKSAECGGQGHGITLDEMPR